MKTVLRKTIVAAAIAGLSLALASAWGAEPMMGKDANDHQPPATGMPGMDPARMREMQSSMMKMHELMHQIQNAKTPTERENLQKQHMQMMQSHMQAMMPMMMQMRGGRDGMMGGQGGMSGGKMGPPPGREMGK